MNHAVERIFEELGDLILAINPERSGPDVATMGTMGMILLDQLEGLLTSPPCSGKRVSNGGELRAGFDCLVNDFRISRAQEEAMRGDYIEWRTKADMGSHAKLRSE